MQRWRALLTMTFGVFCVVAGAQSPPAQQPPAPSAQTPPAAAPGRGGRGGPAVVSPQIEADGRVTFRLLAPTATTVTVGGDINGGVFDIGQLFTRPALRLSPYRTSAKGLYICSSSTPPGGGVHGMCGYYAAKRAMNDLWGIKVDL